MRQLTDSDKKRFKSLANSEYGDFLRNYIDELVRELGDVNTVDSDPLESRRKAIQIVRDNLAFNLKKEELKSYNSPDTYE